MASSINFLGSYSGIDSATVDSLIEAESGKLVQYTNKQASLTSEKNAWKDINTRLNSLYEKLGSLQEDAAFQSRTVTSSDTSKLTISVKTDAQLGNYSVQVNRLATATTMTSGTIPSASGKTVKEALGLDGTFSITNQDYDLTKPEENAFSIDIKAEDSLKDIVGKINEQTKVSGVQAKIIDQKIILTDTKMGDRTFTVGGDLAGKLGLDSTAEGEIKPTVVAGHSAELVVDGITIERNTNNIEDVIEGVTLTLKGISETEKPMTVTVAEDTDKTIKAIQSVVDQYNSVLSFVGDQLDVGDPSAESNKTGVLVGDSTLVRLETGLRSLMTANVNNGNTSIKNMSDLGITVDRDGKATLDSAKLKEALAKDPTAVKKLFFSSEKTEKIDEEETTVATEKENGMTQKMRSLINSYITDKTGIIATKSDTYDQQIKDINTSIASFNERLEKKKANYIAMFTRLDTAMMQAESQMSYLASQFSSSSNNK
ncbi:flagellar filament capping protein FliD [Carnobacterium sp.]|uniref:flagellar filament capping protein FliD n=1 Tax=Carnobacterium sp. TaxID=48221 RepID=UPI0028AA5364|nr:flagellar filament capping protein FliD [Carnobacterium sp.]